MRLVLFSRVPRWYSFRDDRLVRRLAADGHEVAAVVAERTKTLKSAREWLLKLGPRVFWAKAVSKGLRLAGLKRGPGANGGGRGEAPEQSPAARAASADPPVYRVASHNSPECVGLVRSLDPDVIVLRGCGIIKKDVLEIPRLGVINPHYALLPAYRGMDVTEWSALHGDPVAVSVHTVNEGVDTGAVLVSRLVEVEPGDTVGALRDKSAALAVELLAEALRRVGGAGAATADAPQMSDAGRQYFSMHPRLRELANERLRQTA